MLIKEFVRTVGTQNKEFSKLLEQSNALFCTCMERAESLKETIEIECIHHNMELDQVIVQDIKSVIFQAALRKAEEAVIDEECGEVGAARAKFQHSSDLLAHLYDSDDLLDSQRQIVHRLIMAISTTTTNEG